MRNHLVLGEFATSHGMLEALRRLRADGYARLDSYSPYPVDEAAEVLGLKRSRVPLIVLIGGLTGATLGYLLQFGLNGIDYPINVGGRPLNAAPAFVPITFELAILLAGLSAFFGLLVIYRFPQLWHPTQRVEAFRSATLHAFWVSVELAPTEDPKPVMQRLRELGAQDVALVEGGTE